MWNIILTGQGCVTFVYAELSYFNCEKVLHLFMLRYLTVKRCVAFVYLCKDVLLFYLACLRHLIGLIKS